MAEKTQYGSYQNVRPRDQDARVGSESAPFLSGWTVFSGVVMIMAGAFGAINGLIALLNNEVYVTTENRIVLFDFTQWGWIHLIGGAVVALVGLVVLSTGATWARILGVVIVLLQSFGQIAFIEAYPFWTIATIALDITVIYGLLIAPTTTASRYA